MLTTAVLGRSSFGNSSVCSRTMIKTVSYFIAILAIHMVFVEGNGFHGNRNKRTLVYIPPGGVVQMVMGVGLPLILQDESVIVGMVLKAGYNLPDNSTYYTNPGVVYAKKKRSVSRWDLYEIMAQAAKLHGLGGKECILRTICEVADVPVDKSKSLFDELVHAIFTPSSTKENVKTHSDSIYHAAEQIGRQVKGSCDIIFPECQVSFAQIFTKFHNF